MILLIDKIKVVYKTLETLTLYKEKGVAHFVDLQAKAALSGQRKHGRRKTSNKKLKGRKR